MIGGIERENLFELIEEEKLGGRGGGDVIVKRDAGACANYRLNREAFLLHGGRECGVEEGTLACAGRGVQKDDALGDEEIDEVAEFAAAAVELLARQEGPRADVGMGCGSHRGAFG